MNGLIDTLSVIFGTKSWFRGLEDYLGKMAIVIRDGHTDAVAELKRKAEQEGWEDADFDVGLQELRTQYEFAFPRILAFSTISLTYAVVESRLIALANFMREREDQALKISEFKGSSLEKSAVYFKKVLGVSINADPSWQHLKDLEFLRHVIVHKAGKIGQDQDARKHLAGIQQRVGGLVDLDEELGGIHAELRIEFDACLHYVRKAHGFFDRIFQATGLLTM